VSGLVFDRAKAVEIAQALLGALSAANPEIAAAGAVLQSVLEYRAMLKKIKDDQPDLWAEISAEFNADLQAWLDA
jgi:hypothetical protein